MADPPAESSTHPISPSPEGKETGFGLTRTGARNQSGVIADGIHPNMYLDWLASLDT
ncbi:MAG: hypothetical protein ACFB12_00535 [Leptolyngbyaceae cyanobacterium]